MQPIVLPGNQTIFNAIMECVGHCMVDLKAKHFIMEIVSGS